ncbi:MAG: hypothetical protein RLZZ244_2225 [Verrucomicrobiota bacterium]
MTQNGSLPADCPPFANLPYSMRVFPSSPLRSFLCLAALSLVPAFSARAESLLFYGGGLVERLMEGGELEAHLQLAHPRGDLRVRSLAWTGDEVGNRLRPEGYVEHLKELLARWPADTVVLGFGGNESFAGEAGLASFQRDAEGYLREIRRLHPKARLVFLSPIAVQNGGDQEVAVRNREVLGYSRVLEGMAKAEGALFVDLFSASQEAYARSREPLTVQGVHLNALGVREMAKVIAGALLGDAVVRAQEPARVAEVAKAAAQKAGYVAEVVRPKNGVVYYGVRKRPEEYAAEIPRYHQLVEQAESLVHELVRFPEKRFSDLARPTLPPLAEGKSVPDRYSGGILKEPQEQQKDLAVAEGYALNLFASEADFPDLKNPVQIAFDARGRLWVVTMPSFPHTLPGEKPNDKILILEDTQRRGKADKCTVFAEGFDALDGVAFHEKGVIVSAQPRLLLLKDTDGDGRADAQEELLRGVDVTDSHHGGMIGTDAFGQLIFSDGVFHRSQFETPFGVVRSIDSTTYRLNVHSGRMISEWQAMTPNPWKPTFDRYGNLFQRFGGGQVLDGLAMPWTPLGVYHGYGTGTVVNYGKGCAACVVSSPNFPERFQQGVVSASLLGNYTVTMTAVDVGQGPAVGTERVDLLTSQNSAFRPVDAAFGMDGALYVSDFASRIIGHAQHPMRDPQWNHTRGRIWRVVAKERPVVQDWPRIEGAGVPELLGLLRHSQDGVREHARIELRKQGASVVGAVDAWMGALEQGAAGEQGVLEALWVLHTQGEVRPAAIARLMRSEDPRMRAAAVELVRFEADRLPNAEGLLAGAAGDAHPRVRLAVVKAVAHLRGNGVVPAAEGVASNVGGASKPHETHPAGVRVGGGFAWDKVLQGMNAGEAPVKQAVESLKVGVKPAKGRSVPVLEVNPASQVEHWAVVGEVKGGVKKVRTFVESEAAQTVLLSVKHGYLDVSANGVQLLSSDNNYSSQQQIPVDLQPGLNLLEIEFRKLKPKGTTPPVYVYDPLGQLPSGARVPKTEADLAGFAAAWDKAHESERNALKVQAVPNLLQFAPKELRVKAGAPVRLLFENPDLMQHNLVLVAPGAEEEVGLLADQMATKPDGLTKHFVPESPKVLHATALVNPAGRAELSFTAPKQPGSYPFLCTFPGHWRVMKGVLVVE